MVRPVAAAHDIASRILELFNHAEECPLPAHEFLSALNELRESRSENTIIIAQMLMQVIERQSQALSALQEVHGKLRAAMQNLTAPPYIPAVYLRTANTPTIQGALVQTGTERRVVQVGDDVCIDELAPGDEVFLSHERNCLLEKSETPCWTTGEVAAFSRHAGDGRLVLRTRDEELVVLSSPALRAADLKAGETVRFDRAWGLAFEKIEPSKGDEYFLEDTPRDSFAEIGGLDGEIETLKRLLTLHMFHHDTTARYKLRRKKAVLMEGPPGNGKTKMARAACAWLATLSPSGRSHFINVKPGGLNSMWYGATEQKYREIFRVAGDLAKASPEVPVVMFWDEVDAVGGTRGESVHRIDDRMLNAFMAELSGLEERGNVIILAATNRRDALDPALVRPGRLGDLILHFPPPNRQAARAILSCHMPLDIPYAANDKGPRAAREALLDLAVGQIFAYNGDTTLATITLRDGKQRLVRAADLVSGAHLEAIVQAAIERACVREAEGGPRGLTASDVDSAVSDFFVAAPRGLTARNARNYLRDLPQDVDVVRCELVERKVSHPHRYRVEVA
jgi:proteasome-associated ATPase